MNATGAGGCVMSVEIISSWGWRASLRLGKEGVAGVKSGGVDGAGASVSLSSGDGKAMASGMR